MNAAVCPINPPGHDWQAGLSCRWCDATRTPSEAVLSGLASVRGWSREAARTVHAAHRAEVAADGARLIEDAACDADWTRTPDYCAGLRAGAELLLANTGEEATAAAATATPAPDFFEPGRTYTEPGNVTDWRFRCDAITTHPTTGERTALGWKHFRGEWSECSYAEDEWEIHQIADAIGTANTTTGDSK